ncbi:hypothetical protein NPIL_301831 [Nephila pilipes]|uniref:Uncharacterized protein n=1 Tax=Nephila pilipes TaxID=299642 RepID=A0A8X6PH39_NEPPI|nr:hypothetical protein NPIL_301831 [Nephila pilipes]
MGVESITSTIRCIFELHSRERLIARIFRCRCAMPVEETEPLLMLTAYLVDVLTGAMGGHSLSAQSDDHHQGCVADLLFTVRAAFSAGWFVSSTQLFGVLSPFRQTCRDTYSCGFVDIVSMFSGSFTMC